MEINPNIKKDKNLSKKDLNENIIIGYFKIKKDSNKQKIINQFDFEKIIEDFDDLGSKLCQIYINEEKIAFSQYYYFPKEGNYTIKYIFKEEIKSSNYMFFNCNSLISLDLSKFNTKYITNMKSMFYGCISLISLDLSNFNTQNVKEMELMF